MASGIPSLLNQAANAGNITSLIIADSKLIVGLFNKPKLGIYDTNGQLALEPDSFISIEFKREWRISTYPQEVGAFQSYNKVTTPYDAKIRMTKGGNEASKNLFIENLDTIAHSLDLYDIITPEVTYNDANIAHYDYRRTSTNGIGLLTVDIWLTEIRITTETVFTTTARPEGADAVNVGTVQTGTPTASEIARAAGAH